jgi:2-polyprenyl-3-methyl-5-hydroxy-6-metoxy-1,4-benzoquinol methylase
MDKNSLRALYERIYSEGKENFFTFSTADVTKEVLSELNWRGLDVLEVGCGTGETAFLLANSGVKHVLAMDYSENAIKEAKNRYNHNKLEFRVGSFENIEGHYDCIVMQEVIEHTEDPFNTLSLLKEYMNSEGHMIVTCPSFINVRGIVWMTLQILLNVPMSLTDKHFISPREMEKWAKDLSLSLKWRTFRHSLAHSEKMIIDMKKRLTNALGDARLDNSKVDELLDWLKEIIRYEKDEFYNGAKGLYHFAEIKE